MADAVATVDAWPPGFGAKEFAAAAVPAAAVPSPGSTGSSTLAPPATPAPSSSGPDAASGAPPAAAATASTAAEAPPAAAPAARRPYSSSLYVPSGRIHTDEPLPRLPAGTTLKDAAGLIAEVAVVLGRKVCGPDLRSRVLRAAEKRAKESVDEGAAWVASHYRLMAAQLDLGHRCAAMRVLLELAGEVEEANDDERVAFAALQQLIEMRQV